MYAQSLQILWIKENLKKIALLEMNSIAMQKQNEPTDLMSIS